MSATKAPTGTSGWNDPMMKQVRKTLAATTLIMGSSVIAMLLFGSPADGGTVLGKVTRSLHILARTIGDTNMVIAGVVAVLVLMVGMVFWLRNR